VRRLRRLAPERPTRRDLATLGVYALSGAVYIAIGVAVTDFLLSFWVAAAYVLLSAWLIPAAIRRLM
jgi:hypothetical protein